MSGKKGVGKYCMNITIEVDSVAYEFLITFNFTDGIATTYVYFDATQENAESYTHPEALLIMTDLETKLNHYYTH